MATIVKLVKRDESATRFINLESVQDVLVRDEQVTVFFAQDDETANMFTPEEAAPLLDALEMLAEDTAKKVQTWQYFRDQRVGLEKVRTKDGWFVKTEDGLVALRDYRRAQAVGRDTVNENVGGIDAQTG